MCKKRYVTNQREKKLKEQAKSAVKSQRQGAEPSMQYRCRITNNNLAGLSHQAFPHMHAKKKHGAKFGEVKAQNERQRWSARAKNECEWCAKNFRSLLWEVCSEHAVVEDSDNVTS